MGDKTNLLKATKLFSSLKENELNVIAENSEFIDFKNDQVIFTEGSAAESLYIIGKGGVRITKKTQDGKEMDIAKFIPGELFGELDMFEAVPRPAGAIAEEDTTVLVFPRRGFKFQALLDKYAEIFAHILDDLIAMIAHRIRETNKLVSEKTKWIEELRSQILYDQLTGLYNKSYLTEEFPSQITQFAQGASILYVKPDNFKLINDTFGHNAGDGALLLLAKIVKSFLKEKDIGVRYRGNEFVTVFPDTDRDQAFTLANEIRKAVYAIDLKALTGGQDFHLTACVGIALYPEQSKDSNALVDKAFNALVDLQKAGGNRVGLAPN
jgi:diguanylate cyclase (GGDEF)-like protein